MAKKAEEKEINRSEAVREAISEFPKASVKEIVEKLGKRGIKVTTGLVYIVKGKMKKQKRKEVREKVEKMGTPNPVELIVKVKKLALEVGGLAKLKALVDVLAE